MKSRIKPRQIILIISFLLITLAAYKSVSRAEINALGDWSSFTDMNSANEFKFDGELIWGAAPGGAFAIDSDGSIQQKLTNIEGLKGLELNAVDIDSAGNLWLASQNGTLNKFDSDGSYLTYYFIFKRRNVIDEPLVLYDLHADGEWLWIARQEGISKFSIYNNGGEIQENIEHVGPFSREDIKTVFVENDRIWFGFEEGIGYADKDSPYLPDGSEWTVFYEGDPHGLNDFDVRAIAYFRGQLYAGTANGVFEFNESADSSWWDASGLGGLVINSLRVSADTLFAATDSGPYSYGGVSWNQYNPTGYSGEGISDLAYIPGEGLVAAYSDIGYAKFNGQWEEFFIPGPRGLSCEELIAADDNLWAFSRGRRDRPGTAVNHYDGTSWENFNASNSGLVNNIFYTGAIDSSGRTWIGYWGSGLSVYDPADSSWATFDSTNSPLLGVLSGGMASNYIVITALALDAHNNLWIGDFRAFDSHAAYILEPDSTWSEIPESNEDGLSSDLFTRIVIRDDKVMFATEEGLDILDIGAGFKVESDNEWQHFDVNSGLVSNIVYDVDIDRNDYIWIATGQGLNYYDPDFDYVDSLPLPFGFGPTINALEIDGLGNKWIGTADGLLKLSADNSDWVSYTTENSLLVDNEVLALSLVNATGVLWIGTSGGISRFDTGQEMPDPTVSSVSTYPSPAGPEFADRVYFSRVPFGAEIRIYTVAGELVRKFDAGNDSGLTSWNYKNDSGESCAGGVYIYHVINRGKDYSKTGKIVLIR